jgi:hypothetical protein
MGTRRISLVIGSKVRLSEAGGMIVVILFLCVVLLLASAVERPNPPENER